MTALISIIINDELIVTYFHKHTSDVKHWSLMVPHVYNMNVNNNYLFNDELNTFLFIVILVLEIFCETPNGEQCSCSCEFPLSLYKQSSTCVEWVVS